MDLLWRGDRGIVRERAPPSGRGDVVRHAGEDTVGIIICTIIILKSVAVSKLQVAIVARLSREMYQTVRIG